MRLLTAWTGTAPDDFAWTIPGELVQPGEICDRDELGAGDCGCRRAFTGLVSRKATTVAVVAEVDIDDDTLAAIVRDTLVAIGWPFDDEDVTATVEDMRTLGERWPAGTVVRRDRNRVEAA